MQTALVFFTAGYRARSNFSASSGEERGYTYARTGWFIAWSGRVSTVAVRKLAVDLPDPRRGRGIGTIVEVSRRRPVLLVCGWNVLQHVDRQLDQARMAQRGATLSNRAPLELERKGVSRPPKSAAARRASHRWKTTPSDL